MAFITDKDQAKIIFDDAAKHGVSIALFCTGSFWNTEAILLAANNFAIKNNIENIPVVVAMTSEYSHMQQSKRVSYSHDPKVGIRAVFEYARLLSEGDYAVYPNVTVMTHLDHADPIKDRWALTENTDILTSVMFDAQEYPYSQNLEMTREYVKNFGDSVLVEGIIENLAVGDGTAGTRSDDYVEKAVKFIKETGVDFLVADLGTEQQSASIDAKYLKDRAQSLTKELGRKMLVLHGVSSLTDEQFLGFADDGVVRVNMWTRIVREAGQYAAERLYERMDKVRSGDFESTEATDYINDNIAKAAQIMENTMGLLGYANLAK